MTRNEFGAYCPEGALLSLFDFKRGKGETAPESLPRSMEETRLRIEKSEVGNHMEDIDDEACVLV